jgi:hypothetical protein
VIEDLVDDSRLDDESENFHSGPAPRTIEGLGLVDTVNELGPSTAQGAPGCRLVGFTVRLDPGGVVGPVEEDEVSFGLGNMDEDSGQELEGIDEGVVVLDGLPALGLIEQEL